MEFITGEVVAVAAVLFYSVMFKIFRGELIGYPIYIYVALFPFNTNLSSVIQLNDLFKILFIFEIIIIISRSRKLRVNKYEASFFAVIIVSNFLYYRRNGGDSDLLMGITNILFTFCFTFLFNEKVRSEVSLKAFMRILAYNGVAAAIFALAEYFLSNVARASGTMSNPNFLAYYITIALVAAEYTYTSKIWRLIFQGIMIYGIVVTGSLSCILSVICLALVKVVYSIKLQMLKKIITVGIAVIIFIGTVFSIMITVSDSLDRFEVIMKLIGGKDMTRVIIWQDAISDWSQHKLFGIGYNCWRSLSLGWEAVSHNDPLRILVELGLAGVIVFALYIYACFRAIMRSNGQLQHICMELLICVYLFSMFHNNVNSIMFWLPLSIIISENKWLSSLNKEQIVLFAWQGQDNIISGQRKSMRNI